MALKKGGVGVGPGPGESSPAAAMADQVDSVSGTGGSRGAVYVSPRRVVDASKSFRRMTEGDVINFRLIVCSAAPPRRGKTHFALTMPKLQKEKRAGMAYFSFDKGLEGVGREFIGKHVDVAGPYTFETPRKGDQSSKRVQAEAQASMDQFLQDFEYAAGKYRSLAFDTATEIWNLFRVARLGKLTQVMPHNYTEVNTEFRELFRILQSNPVNVNLIHKVKDEWKNDASGKGTSTGRMVRAGWGDAEYESQVSIVHDRDFNPSGGDAADRPSGSFFFTVYDCTQNADLVGRHFVQPDNTWMDLGINCYPESSPEDWI